MISLIHSHCDFKDELRRQRHVHCVAQGVYAVRVSDPIVVMRYAVGVSEAATPAAGFSDC